MSNMYAAALLDARISVPSQGAAIASQKTVVSMVRLNGPALRTVGVSLADVAAKLQLKVFDVKSGAPVLLKTVLPAGVAPANGSSNCQEYGTMVNLVSLLTVAGDYELVFSWDLTGDVKDAAGATVLSASTVFPVSTCGRFTAT